MPIEIRCENPDCRRKFSAPDHAAGKRARCPACKNPTLIPDETPVDGTIITHAKRLAKPTQASKGDTVPSAGSFTQVDQQIGRYVILHKLGAGAFGTVYRAYDPQLDREVALKVPNAAVLDSPKRVKRFLREAKSAANLRHPHIVPVFDAGQEGDRYYIATAFIDGQPLADHVEERGNDFRQAATWAKELAEALAYAHEQGIVHRDVKPANCMVDQHSHLHLMDFGLAFRQEEEARLTNDGAVMGTPAYMSPEQALGQETGPAADQYSVGIVLYELLCGHTPFEGPAPVVIHNQIHTEAEPIRNFRPYVPKDLETICEKALRKEPGQRYGNCQELADDLRRWLEGEPILARRLGPIERTVKWAKRNRMVAGLLATVALVMIIGTVVSSYFAIEATRRAAAEAEAKQVAQQQTELVQEEKRRAEEERRRAEEEKRRAEESEKKVQLSVAEAKRQQELAQQSAEEAKRQQKLAEDNAEEAKKQQNRAETELKRSEISLYANDLDRAVSAIRAGDSVKAYQYLMQCKPELYSWEHFYFLSQLGNRQTLPGHDSGVTSTCLSPNSRWIVSGSGDNTVKVWDAETGKELRTLTGHTAVIHSVCLSADGRLIISGSGDNTVKVWDAETGKELRTLAGHTSSVRSVCVSPDGRRIVSGSQDKTVKVWDAATGQELQTLNGHVGPVASVRLSPNSRWIVSGSSDKMVKLWNAETGKEVQTLNGHVGPVASVCVSPDGRRIVSASEDRTVKVWDAATGNELRTLAGHNDRVSSVCVSPDGQWIVSGSLDKTVKVWDAETGKEMRTLAGHTSIVWSVCMSPDGRRIVSGSADRTVKAWDAEAGKELRILAGHTKGVTSACVNPDGRRIVSGSVDSTVKVWDSESGKELRTLTGHAYSVTSVCVSPDGRWIVSGSVDKTVKIWDSESGKELRTLVGHTDKVTSVCMSPGGSWIISGSEDKTVKVWDAESGKELRTLAGHADKVASVCASADGCRVISGSRDETVKVWDAETGKKLLSLAGHTDAVRSVCVSPDGRRILSGSRDRTVKVWDAETGKELRTLAGHTDEVLSVCMSPDGWRIVSGSADQTVIVRAAFINRNQANNWPLSDAANRIDYHTQQAAEAEKGKQPFAAAFHYGRLLLDQPDNREWQQKRKGYLQMAGVNR